MNLDSASISRELLIQSCRNIVLLDSILLKVQCQKERMVNMARLILVASWFFIIWNFFRQELYMTATCLLFLYAAAVFSWIQEIKPFKAAKIIKWIFAGIGAAFAILAMYFPDWLPNSRFWCLVDVVFGILLAFIPADRLQIWRNSHFI